MFSLLNKKYRLACVLVYLPLMIVVGCQSDQLAAIDRNSSSVAVWQDEAITFTDPALGLTLDLPNGWSIHPRIQGPDNTDPIDKFGSPCLNSPGHIVPPCTTIQLTLGSPQVQSLDAMRELDQFSAPSVVLEERELDLNGLAALWAKIEDRSVSEHPIIQVLILVDDHIVILNAYGELSPVDEIIASVRPVE